MSLWEAKLRLPSPGANQAGTQSGGRSGGRSGGASGGRSPARVSLHIIGYGLLLLVPLGGCRSRFIQASIENNADTALHVVELDYPGASFGVSTLAPHSSYSYRFKLLGSGPLALTYTDSAGKPHTAAGPDLKEGQGGSLLVKVGDDGKVSWQPVLRSR